MADIIYPNRMLHPVTPIGIDQASDWRSLRLEKPSDGDCSLRVATPPERVPSWAACFWTATVAAHATTERWAYTVPSGRRAILLAVFFGSTLPSTGKYSTLWITLNTYRLALSLADSTSAIYLPYRTLPMHLWLMVDDVLKGYSYHDSTGNVEMYCNAFVMEYDV